MALYELDGIKPALAADDECWVAPSAAVIGKVRIDKLASIWFGAVLRGDNELIHIAEGSNIQDNCTIHTDPGFPVFVGPRATIGHNAILHGCRVGETALVGMGATVLNGARIGKGAIVGANALVAEGKEIPDFALAVGAPARVVRQLDEASVLKLRAAADIYIQKWQRYRTGLKIIAG